MNTHVVSSISSTFTTGGICRFTRATKGLRTAARRLAILTAALALCLAGSVRANQSMSLAWNAVNDPSVIGYAVYMGGADGVYTSRFDAGSSTAITITGLKEGQTNYFAVAAYNSARLEGTPTASTSYIVPGLVKLAPPALRGGPMTVSFPVAAGHSYQLQASTNLQSWTNLWQTTVWNSNTWAVYADPQSGSYARRFYRLILN